MTGSFAFGDVHSIITFASWECPISIKCELTAEEQAGQGERGRFRPVFGLCYNMVGLPVKGTDAQNAKGMGRHWRAAGA